MVTWYRGQERLQRYFKCSFTPSFKESKAVVKAEFKMTADSGVAFTELENVGEQAFGGKWELLWGH